MNKRILTVALCLTFGLSSVFAQELIEVKNKFNDVEVDIDLNTNHSLLKKMEYAGWYSFLDASFAAFNIQYGGISNATVFPDTSVYQLYGDGSGGTLLAKTGTFSVGQVFYPQDTNIFFNSPNDGVPANFSRFNSYVVDSIFILWRYAHKVPGSVDTLFIQFYNDDKIIRDALVPSGREVAFVPYNHGINGGSNATSDTMILLTADDTTDWMSGDFNGLTLPVPNGGLQVPAGGLSAYTLSYRPGYSYEEGDTIEFDWEFGAPDKKLNHFITRTMRNTSKFMKDFRSFGMGLSATTLSAYGPSWTGLYIPGSAWNLGDYHQYMAYHAVTQNFSVPIVEKVPMAVYPNPVTDNSALYINPEVSQDYKKFELMDQSGRVISVFDRPASYEGVQLNVAPGVYFVKFIGENSIITNKLVVE